jgi:hypothetical protein
MMAWFKKIASWWSLTDQQWETIVKKDPALQVWTTHYPYI